MKVAVLGNQARAMSNFWTVLLRRMVAAGHEVICLIPPRDPSDDAAWENALQQLGVRLVQYPLDRKGLHPVRDAKTVSALRRIFLREKPDVLFAFTIKAVIYGAFAAALAGYPRKKNRHVMITGLGFMFEGDTFLKKILLQVGRGLYRSAFSLVQTVFFQNNDDRQLFDKLSITYPSLSVCNCKGTGVDLERFAFSPKQTVQDGSTTHFLFIGRLLEAKGLRDLAEAARIIKAAHPAVEIAVLGPEEKGVGAVPLAEVLAWQAEGILLYLGETRDVRPYVEKADVVVLPSWREGAPCSLLEAMSMGRPVVAADAPGSREVVRHGVNGYLVPVRDGKALAAALIKFIETPELVAAMGKESRAMVEADFSADAVADHLLHVMGLDPATR